MLTLGSSLTESQLHRSSMFQGSDFGVEKAGILSGMSRWRVKVSDSVLGFRTVTNISQMELLHKPESQTPNTKHETAYECRTNQQALQL